MAMQTARQVLHWQDGLHSGAGSRTLRENWMDVFALAMKKQQSIASSK